MNEFKGTPHNTAKIGEIAKVVLMPGDPLRAKFIAETFLTNVVQFNQIRNIFGYTGDYQGHRISVMGSGMGMPSIGIYSYELFKFYGVEAIIRIGSSGSFREEVKIYDVVLASSSSSQSTYAKMQNGFEGDTIYPDAKLNETLISAAQKLSIPMHVGPILCGDVFYSDVREDNAGEKYLCAEMESFALFHNANVLGKKAACLVTISDSMVTKQETTAQERELAFTNMMKIALEAAVEYSK
jgi:purine-nucleoside phosphorylase